MIRLYKIPDETKKRIYKNAGEKNNLPPYAIEKDWWVVQTLSILYNTKIGEHLVFKGGTSLSKAWDVIERFSEDIDMSVDRTFFGFEGELGKSQRTKLRKTANKYLTEVLFPELKEAFKKAGLKDVKIELEEIKSSDQDPVIISVYYLTLIESPGYIQPRVQIEIGCRSLREPFENRSILSLIDSSYPKANFKQESIQIPTVLPERTFLEKIFLLHEEFQRPKEKIRVDRMSRHLYDIYQISKTAIVEKALEEKDLYETIVKHRYNYTRIGGVDYNLHQPQTIDFLPSKELAAAWKTDYNKMQEQMIYGDSPKFEDLIESLTQLKGKINPVDWKMDAVFPTVSK
ncbi:MAG: nucleotidyl transferase AbiEii/AbiGii toxin family protein [Bacteroidales bacterium]|nr:nucleotidyl transferase AbiEii/AbiGii toxin family protein [Bacteroidales bacterium]